jgi:hypothetical protein
MSKKKAESKRFKITQGDKVYSTYASTSGRAAGIFMNSPHCSVPTSFKIKQDDEEWKTTLQDGRIAPGK